MVLTGMPRPVLGESCTTSIKDFAIFPPHQKKRNVRDHLNDDPRPGRPEALNRAVLVEKVREIIAIDANFTVRMLAEELNLSHSRKYTILTEDLVKRKIWVWKTSKGSLGEK